MPRQAWRSSGDSARGRVGLHRRMGGPRCQRLRSFDAGSMGVDVPRGTQFRGQAAVPACSCATSRPGTEPVSADRGASPVRPRGRPCH
ncbi:hypothetical protein DLJ61_23020 [Gordonia terrae]|uniref:Uncharacterized protein n=1 Tax=Gordonia terrae TaxID=2055 RepID=A0AAD0KFY0_9ACTN|nr:hypothetical protein DLJ61_23020 [Gordonia terrae]